jgi:cytochrome oxidase Cu insertion factor (SCO1/SenC/PrrC family)
MTRKKASKKGSERTKLHRWLIVACILLAVLLSGWYMLQPKKGDEADFSLVDVDGETFHMSDFRGKVVLLDFMATWCGPCQASMSSLQELQDEFGDYLVIISISVDPSYDTKQRLRSWMNSWEANWIHARDLADPPISQLFEVTGIPTYFLVDKHGDIRYRHVGLTSETTLKEEISELMG